MRISQVVPVTVSRIESYIVTVTVDHTATNDDIADAAIRQLKTDRNAVPDYTTYEVTDEMGEEL